MTATLTEKVTGEQLRQQAQAHGIEQWDITTCICGYVCGFRINGSTVRFDNGCWCISGPLRPSSWDEVADHFNLQRTPRVIAEYRAFWHLPEGQES